MKQILTVLFIISALFAWAEDDIVQISIQSVPGKMYPGTSQELTLRVDIIEDWHINSAKILDDYSIAAEVNIKADIQIQLSNILYPKGEIKKTKWGGKLSLYEGEIQIPITLDINKNTVIGEHEITFIFTYQACNDTTCLSPEKIYYPVTIYITEIPREISDNQQPIEQERSSMISKEERPQILLENRPIAEKDPDTPFENKNILIILIMVFFMGLALNLTPCVYPLIPITMGYFISQKDRRSPVLLAVMYVVGLAITYSIVGTLAALSGSMMGSLLAHPATLIFFSVLMLALSLSMFGLYEFKLPNVLTQVGGGSKSGALGALIMGLTMGIVAAPCVGPFVVSLLSFVAQKGNLFIGFITFFILALGLGMPYLFLGIFSAKISSLPRSGEWLNSVRIFFGLALVGMAIYFILPLLPDTIGSLLLPIYMIAAAVYFAVIDKSGLSIPGFSRSKVVLAMIVLALGIIMIKPVISDTPKMPWEEFSNEAVLEAISDKKPIIIDFYADWCNPCKELEHITFTDPEVQGALQDFIRLKVDVTIARDATDTIRDQFNIVGVPTIIFYDSTGKKRDDLRLNGFEKPDDFIRRLEAALLK